MQYSIANSPSKIAEGQLLPDSHEEIDCRVTRKLSAANTWDMEISSRAFFKRLPSNFCLSLLMMITVFNYSITRFLL